MSTKMEQPFYHDDSFLSAYGHSDAAMHDYKLLKQNMNLNLTEPYRNLKSQLRAHQTDLYQGGQQDAQGSLKLASPELERLIIQNSHGVITTPTPGQYFYNRSITDEQEGFAEGFVKALDELHKMNQIPPNVSIGAGGLTTCSAAASSVFGSALQPEPPIYTTLNAYCPNTSLSTSASSYPTATISYLPPHQQQSHQQQTSTHAAHPFQHALHSSGLHPQRLVALKEEPQTVPDLLSSDGSPPMSPIDLESQERIKAERKRLRNRLAATKCRKRKLERIARLEEKVKGLKSDNQGLSNTASVLRDQVAQLKQKVLTHVSSGCQLMLTSKMEAF
ncbi:LOW QUALITY PROTEIN: junB proto-oncogene, AP-1 transcription factor subunit b [Brachionichthys hirsutus]|uniref:LOW QUALITY PROTEIN: junB proto-oncogene, AP-1 transcription factor subunit b n=1 Tax=Brachionichthys hirsutus TaxID=412623 RepID=UPI0036047CD6